MKIKMLQSYRGSDVDHTGVSMGSRLYSKDQVLEVVPKGGQPGKDLVGQALAQSFVEAAKVAELVGESDSPTEDTLTEGAKEGAPENKMESEPENNKRRGGRSRR